MGVRFDRALHIFRRDLRLVDNRALLAASRASRSVRTVFIFDPRQIEDHPYRSLPGLEFLRASLRELEAALSEAGGKLGLRLGSPSEVLEGLIRAEKIEAVFVSRDYTPFARARDEELQRGAELCGAKFFSVGDALLHDPEEVLKDDGQPYTVYTPYSRKSLRIGFECAEKAVPRNLCALESPGDQESVWRAVPDPKLPGRIFLGGRAEALAVLSRMRDFRNYEEVRDLPAVSGTTGLSAHLKFGTISPREVLDVVREMFGLEHCLVRELMWRDFFTQIGFHFPHVFEGAFQRHYQRIDWENDAALFECWKSGRTGFPLVDAGMRQLSASGFMHNRVRMVVASFLTKDLLVDWRWGERHFARTLIDYDPAVNNGNWQWAASTGCDAQPYFRVFNPWLQQEKFDSECRYIKRWVPELASLSPKQIHGLAASKEAPLGYCLPVVDHAERKARAIRLFERD